MERGRVTVAIVGPGQRILCHRLYGTGWRQGALERDAENRARRPRQKLQRGAVGVAELAGDVESEARSARTGGEERLEDLRAELGRHARPIVAQLADHRIAHVAGACRDVDASRLAAAVLPRVAHEVPGDLAQMPAIEHDAKLAIDVDRHAARANAFGLHDLLGDRGDEVAKRYHLGLLTIAPIELEHLADDAVDTLRVAADHAEQTLPFRRDAAVFLEELRRLVDRGERIAHLVRNRRGEAAQRR